MSQRSPDPSAAQVPGRMAGQRVLITGGSRGIGEAIATAMCRAGAQVFIASRKAPGIEAAAQRIRAAVPGAQVLPVVMHVGQVDQLQGAVDALVAAHGPIDVLVNNAATNPYFGPMQDLAWPAWHKTFQVNLEGPFALARAVAGHLRAAGQPGCVLFVSSVFGMLGSPGQGIYGMTKAALISLTRTLAIEWGPDRIRVNALAPGLVDTRFAAALTSDPALAAGFTDRAALGRIAQPEEIAGMAVALASSEGSFVTGQTLAIDGGYTIA